MTHTDKKGYIQEYNSKHPFSQANGYVRQHRLAYERSWNCCLLPWVEIDHIDGDRSNNHISNLQPTTHSKHMERHKILGVFRYERHNRKDMSDRLCNICGSSETAVTKKKNGTMRPKWQHLYGEWTCDRCYKREWQRENYGYVIKKPSKYGFYA